MRKRDVWQKAYAKGLRRLVKDKRLTATEISCGFAVLVTPSRDKSTWEDVQVFMKICRFSKKLLKEKPMTGGLLCNKKS